MSDDSDKDRSVFVVHGRNELARRAMFEFLRCLDLRPLEWNIIVKATGETSPFIGDILAKGFEMAQAAVVLMTPDDEARLKPEFWKDDDKDEERKHTGQPRQNVLFEAGLALGANQDRTVIVELGQIREMSDTLGRHVIRMDGSTQLRQQFAQRLESAGCKVNMDGTDWQTFGDFQAAVAGTVGPEVTESEAGETESEPTPPPPSVDERRRAAKSNDFVKLGEHLWYLTSPPITQVNNVTAVIRTFLTLLDKCGLKRTRHVASSLEGISLLYNIHTNYITPQSCNTVGQFMVPIRKSLDGELQE